MDDMKFSYISTRSDVKRLIQTFGGFVTIKLAVGASVRTVGVAIGKKQEESDPISPSMTSIKMSTYYVPGDLRKAPDAGDFLEVSSTEAYLIVAVEPIKPANTVIAYKLTVQG
jgi:hypothetical protein